MKSVVKASTPSLTVGAARGRGRPRAAEPGSTVSAWVPASVHDKLVAVAKSEDTSVSAIVEKAVSIMILNINVFQVVSKQR